MRLLNYNYTRAFLFFTFCCCTFFTVSAQWESMGGPSMGNVADMAYTDKFLFAVNDNGIFRSDTAASLWINISGDLPLKIRPFIIRANGDMVFIAGSPRGAGQLQNMVFYLSYDNGNTWQYIPPPVAEINSFAFLMLPDKLIFSTGFVWDLPFDDLRWRPNPLNDLDIFPTKLSKIGNKIYAHAWSEIAESSDGGNTWQQPWATETLKQGSPYGIWASGDTMMVARNVNNYQWKNFITYNKGQTWNILTNFYPVIIEVVEYQGIPVARSSGMYYSMNNGAVWINIPTSMFTQGIFPTPYGLFFSMGYSAKLCKINAVTDTEWEDAGKGIAGYYAGYPAGNQIITDDERILVTGVESGVSIFEKDQQEWITTTGFFNTNSVYTLAKSDDRYLMNCNSGTGQYFQPGYCFGFSSSNGVEWYYCAEPNDWDCEIMEKIACVGNNCLAKNDDMIFHSDDNGASWKFLEYSYKPFAVHKGQFYSIKPDNSRLQISSDGLTWSPADTIGLYPGKSFNTFYAIGNSIYAWVYTLPLSALKLYRSDDDGFSWKAVSTISSGSGALYGNDQVIFQRLDYNNNYYSLDKGETWTLMAPRESEIWINSVDEDYVYGKKLNEISDLFRMPVSSLHHKQFIGVAFHDQDGNGIKSADEPPLAGIVIKSVSSGSTLVSDTLGRFSLTLNMPPGGKDSLFSLAPETWQLQPVQYFTTVADEDSLIYIPFKTAGSPNDLAVFCGQTKPLKYPVNSQIIAVCKNIGSVANADPVKMYLKPSPEINIAAILPQPDQQIADTLFWDVPPLMPDSVFIVKLDLKTPAGIKWDARFQFFAGIIPVTPDANALNNHTAVLLQQQFYSWGQHWLTRDQDFISKSDIAAGKPVNFCAFFENQYHNNVKTVRFVHDFKDEFDLRTLKIVAASHPFNMQQNDRDIAINLKTIDLPDTSESENSRCFVLFSIQPHKDLAAGTFIDHASELRYNIGNGASSLEFLAPLRVVDEVTITAEPTKKTETLQLKISPNPANNSFRIITSPAIDLAEAFVTIYDPAGRECFSQKNAAGTIRTSLPPGIYIVRVNMMEAVKTCMLTITR